MRKKSRGRWSGGRKRRMEWGKLINLQHPQHGMAMWWENNRFFKTDDQIFKYTCFFQFCAQCLTRPVTGNSDDLWGDSTPIFCWIGWSQSLVPDRVQVGNRKTMRTQDTRSLPLLELHFTRIKLKELPDLQFTLYLHIFRSLHSSLLQICEA